MNNFKISKKERKELVKIKKSLIQIKEDLNKAKKEAERIDKEKLNNEDIIIFNKG